MANKVVMKLVAEDGASKALKSVGKESKLSAENVKKLGTALAAVGAAAVAAAAALVTFTQKMADYKNEVLDASTRTGVAVDTLAGLRLAAKGSGLQFKTMEGILKSYTARIAAADMGSLEAVEGFENLGVAIRDDMTGSLRDSDVVFREVLTRLGEMEPGADRTTAAIQALGTKATFLFQALGDPKNLDHFVQKAKEFGVDFGPKSSKAAGDWQRSVADFSLVMMGSADKIARAMGSDGMAGVLNQVTEAIIFMATMVVEWLIPTFDSWWKVIQNGIKMFLALGETVLNTTAAITTALTTGDVEGALATWSNKMERITHQMKQLDISGEDLTRTLTGGVGLIGDAWDKAGERAAAYRQSTTIERFTGGGGAGGRGAGGDGEGEGLLAGMQFEISDDDLAAIDDIYADAFSRTLLRIMKPAEVVGGLSLSVLSELQKSMADVGDSLAKSRRTIMQESRLESLQTGAQAIGGAALGAVGISGAGSVLALLAEGPKAIRETAAELQDSLLTAMKTLPIALGEIIPEVMTKLPGAIIEALPQLIAGMVEATPKMMKAVAIDLPIAFMRAIVDADWSRLAASIGESFKAWWESIKTWISDLFSFGLSNRNDENLEWWRLRAKWQERNKDDETGSFAVGARFVDRTGMALIHQGEQVVPRGGSTTGTAARSVSGGGGVSVTINTNVVDSDALPALVRQLERVFGTFGRSSSTLFAS